MIETGAHVAHPSQLAVIVDAENQRAKMRTLALRFGEAADHKFLLVDDLDLPPFPAAPRFVATGRVFGEDAFETVLTRRFQHGFAGAGK